MSRLVAMGGLLLWAALAQAQPLHTYPLKATYASPAEYPTFSAQLHWPVDAGRTTPDDTCAVPRTDTRTCAHVHSDLTCAYLGEFLPGSVASCRFTITLHHLPGYVYA